MKCINCGYHLKRSETVCPYCGTGVQEMTPPSAREAVPPVRGVSGRRNTGTECKNCGYHLKRREDVCPYCGTVIRETVSKSAARLREPDLPVRPRPGLAEVAARNQAIAAREKTRRLKKRIALGALGAAAAVCIIVGVSYNNEYQVRLRNQREVASRAYAAALIESRVIGRIHSVGVEEITVEKADRLRNWKGKMPDDGMEYVAVTLTVKNAKSDFTHKVDFKSFVLLDVRGNGRGYDRIEGMANERLERGEYRTGVLVFAVPANTASTLLYQPNPLGEKMMVPLF